ncbi:MAG: hypothetical protein KC546_08925 [Anaerolineae bacterium]|nr:hypothetical protein [Anaerolineae bacterium]
MTTDNKTENKKQKRPWSEPTIERVQLNAEEAVLTACKSQSGIIGAWLGDICSWLAECRNVGS